MRACLLAVSFALVVLLPGTPAWAAKTYSGEEAAALRCAAILSMVPTAMNRMGLMSRQNLSVFHAASGIILTRYVSGTQRQKLKARETVIGRRDASEHVKDFQTRAKTCIRQFPLS